MTDNINTVAVTGNYTPTSREWGDRLYDVINVRDFGAVGDGTTDDTTAIQRAVDWCVSGTAWFPDLVASAQVTSGMTLTFASVPEIYGRFCNPNSQTRISDFTTSSAIGGTSSTANTFGVAVSANTITLNQNVTGTVQIGDAIRMSPQRRGMIYFPPGNYKLTASITFAISTVKYIHFLGAAGAMITGSFNDCLLKNGNSGEAQQSIVIVEGIDFIQSGTSGKCIELASNLCGVVRNCRIVAEGSSGVGITFESGGVGGASQIVEYCNFSGGGKTSNSIGIVCGNGAMVIGCDSNGCGTFIRHSNQGFFFTGGRHENNGLCIKLGWREDGSDYISSGVMICGLSVESNGTFLDMRNSNNVVVEAIGIQCNDAVSGSDYGVVIDGGYAISFNGVTVSGNGFVTITAGFVIGNGASGQTISRLSFRNCGVPCPATAKWDFTPGVVTSGLEIVNCADLVNGGILFADRPSSPSVGHNHMIPFSDSNTSTRGAAITAASTWAGVNVIGVYASSASGWTVM
jgi:hypothetical protein